MHWSSDCCTVVCCANVVQQRYLSISAWDPLLRMKIYLGLSRCVVMVGSDIKGAWCQIPRWLHPAFHDPPEMKLQPPKWVPTPTLKTTIV